MDIFELTKKNASVVAALIGVITSLVAATILLTMGKVTSTKIGDFAIEAPRPAITTVATENIEKEISAIKAQIATLTTIPKEVAVASELQSVKKRCTKTRRANRFYKQGNHAIT